MTKYRKPTVRLPEGRAARLKARHVPGAPLRRVGRPVALLAVACIAFAALPGPAAAIQILDAADHAELEASVSATGVSRVALVNDRIRRVVRSLGGFDVSHDAASGDLYLSPAEVAGPAPDDLPGPSLPVTLFLGSEQGFTYRLTLTPDARPSAQVLIRNVAAVAESSASAPSGAPRDNRVAELVRLVQAATSREPLPGTIVEAGRTGPEIELLTIETWRGARFTTHVLAVGPDTDAAVLAGQFGTGVAAVWVAAPRDSAAQERLAVVVTEPDRAGAAR